MTQPEQDEAATFDAKSYIQSTDGSSQYRERLYTAIRNSDDAALVLLAETAASVRSIRRILMWTMVIFPVALVLVAVVLGASAPGY